MGILDEVTDVQRLRLLPGDALVVRVRYRVSQPEAELIKAQVRSALGLDEATRVLVLPDAMSLDVVVPDEPSDEERIRDAMAEAQDHPGRMVTR
jgi:hypothetical protein